MRGERKAPARRRSVIEHRLNLRLEELRVEEKEEGGRRIGDIHGINRAVAEIFFREKERRSIPIGGQLMSSDGLPVGQRGHLRILFATDPFQVGHKLRVKSFAT